MLRKIQGEEIQGELVKIEHELLKLITPQVFSGSDGQEVRMIKGFEDACILLSQHNIHVQPKKMNVLSFFQAIDNLKKQQKSRKK